MSHSNHPKVMVIDEHQQLFEMKLDVEMYKVVMVGDHLI
jgi:hypothetical protein